MLKRHKRKAFTLVELIVVIVILAVLAAIAFMVLTKMIGKSRDSRRIADLSTMTKSLEMFLFSPDKAVVLTTGTTQFNTLVLNTSTHMVYQGPFSTEYWTTLRNDGFDALNKLPMDPQGRPYVIGIYAKTAKDYSLGGTLENQDSDTVGTMAIIDGNTFNKTIARSGSHTIKFPSLIFTGNYADLTSSNKDYDYTLGATAYSSTGAIEAAAITEDNKTSRIPYKLTE